MFVVDGTLFPNPVKLLKFSLSALNTVYYQFSGNLPCSLQSSKLLSSAPISESDVSKALKHLRSPKSVCIPAVVMKGSSQIFIHVLTFIFNITLSQQQEATTILVKKSNSASVNNYTDNIYISIIFQKVSNLLYMATFLNIFGPILTSVNMVLPNSDLLFINLVGCS